MLYCCSFLALLVFPTCVGVFLTSNPVRDHNKGLPHVRGGVSLMGRAPWGSTSSSPRAWGCFYPQLYGGSRYHVFPTCVGVFLTRASRPPAGRSLPHVRGGVSAAPALSRFLTESSPRAWGCFRGRKSLALCRRVFPTCVGVFPWAAPALVPGASLPHVRGGVSDCKAER